MLASGWFGRMFVRFTDNIFANTPILRSLYSTLKQLFHTILGDKTNSFREVVLIEFPHDGCWSIGFITGESKRAAAALEQNEELLFVFVPTTPNPTNGFLIMAPRSRLRKSDMTVEQALKAVVSMGMTESPLQEDETAAP